MFLRQNQFYNVGSCTQIFKKDTNLLLKLFICKNLTKNPIKCLILSSFDAAIVLQKEIKCIFFSNKRQNFLSNIALSFQCPPLHIVLCISFVLCKTILLWSNFASFQSCVQKPAHHSHQFACVQLCKLRGCMPLCLEQLLWFVQAYSQKQLSSAFSHPTPFYKA